MDTEKKHAGAKAKNDVSKFLHEAGFLGMFIDSDMNKYEKRLFFRSNFRKKLSDLNKGDVLAIQYPFYMGDYIVRVIIEETRKKDIKTILIIHDIASLRWQFDNEAEINKEINLLNGFDILIVHNTSMTDWLRENHCQRPIVNLELFDYSIEGVHDFSKADPGKRRVLFAGNLAKAHFLNKITPHDYKLVLFGNGVDTEVLPDSVSYKGSFAPEELLDHLEGEYGLVWDGDDLEQCTGDYGNYLKYNNPHKMSLYISCRLPIIIWKEAAQARFVEEKDIGIAVSSLTDLDRRLRDITEERYLKMQKNVAELSSKTENGYFIKKAIKNAMKILKKQS
ncbi:sugar transferase [Sporolactobacillus putidus]|nr:sugar transferase [Sporolactobacillus putidus]